MLGHRALNPRSTDDGIDHRDPNSTIAPSPISLTMPMVLGQQRIDHRAAKLPERAQCPGTAASPRLTWR